MVILPSVDVMDAQAIAQRLFDQIGELEFEYDNEVIKIQISVGVSSLDVEDKADSLDKLLSRADQALYFSKGDKDKNITVYSDL